MNCQYFPYLRGKQAELLALREFSKECSSLIPFVFPVIEPVKEDSSALERSAKVMMENGMRFSIILNPKNGDFEVSNKSYLEQLSDEFKDGIGQKWIPAFSCLNGLIPESLSPQKSLLVCQGRIEASDKIKSLLESPNLFCILDGTENSRSFSRYLFSLKGKRVVMLEDNFRSQLRNSDYAKTPKELFSEAPWYYKEDGYAGLGDYTVIPRIFRDGGMLPYAVAIHLTYQKEKSINIRHFVSDSNSNQSNIQGKFQEAASKVKVFYDDDSYKKTYGVSQLLSSYESGQYPGLGAIKKWSILNHLELMGQLIKDL